MCICVCDRMERLKERLARERDAAVSEIKAVIELVLDHKQKMATLTQATLDKHTKAKLTVAHTTVPSTTHQQHTATVVAPGSAHAGPRARPL